ncbi:hypothetical protein [Aquimarina sp. 2201CG5-10]|uniref:hypothetical protein n=1 Tax=Aquimarina callyspongiae TaxID=3098150 RepID=UPI002AB35859|nr:hypothetical protein [Aquimarina sp. 2201CG5-10]MDY8135721.1 hypothetical protein [Aquimarina sp. 2201CG5-10]
MSLEEDILIQKFLKNKLSEKERNEVLLRIENDEVFCEKVNFEKQLILNLNDNEWSISTNTNHPEVTEYEELLQSQSTQELKSTLEKVNSDYQNKRKKTWFLYSSAAAIIIIIGLTIFSSINTSTDTLYAEYSNFSELPSLVDRGNNEERALLIDAQKFFETKEYDQALHILTTNFNDPQDNKAAIFLYTGIAQMELERYDAAEKTFNTLINSKLIDVPKARWYKALLFIKKSEISKAKEVLSKIARSPSNYKYKEASELLDQL